METTTRAKLLPFLATLAALVLLATVALGLFRPASPTPNSGPSAAADAFRGSLDWETLDVMWAMSR